MTNGIETPIDSQTMRAARRRWASGVSVVLTRDGDGFRGATVAAFAVVSLEPPTVLVCLARDARMSTRVPDARSFTVSILDQSHEFLAERFAGRAPLVDPRLTGVEHLLTASGLPVLIGALAWFECRVSAVHDGGDHVVIVGAVHELGVGDDSDDPLLYYEGQYRSLAP